MTSFLLRRALLPAVIVASTVAAFTGMAPSSSAAITEALPKNRTDGWTAHRRDSTGLYTAAQADRGLEVYKAVCSECHELEDFTHPDFLTEWEGSTLYDLFESIRTTMPDENPGTLTRAQYTDVLTYLLKLNALPEGPVEFSPDSASATTTVLNFPPPPSP